MTSVSVQNAVVFDLTHITAGEMSAFLAGLRDSNSRQIGVGFSKLVSNCPREWGEPDQAQTYINLPYFGEFQELVKQFRQVAAVQQVITDKKLDSQIEFDLRAVTVADMDGFFKAVKDTDNEAISKVLAKLVSKCPEAWGKPSEYKTFMNLPYYGAFQQVIQMLVGEVNGKN